MKSIMLLNVKNANIGILTFISLINDWNDLPVFLISSAEMSDDCVSKFSSLVRARD